jgi:phosphatidylglycerol---prolipoprotein diacylglyceryl transferase
MEGLWQSLPLSLDPILGFLGPIPVTWYALTYAGGAVLAAFYFVSLARRRGLVPDAAVSIELIVTVLWGVLIGARIGYIFIYGDISEYLQEPWRIFSPYDFSLQAWVGIRGMSFHGGLVGGALGLWFFTREANRHFLDFSDALVQAVPLALLFGRLGNFLNQELPGRITDASWGMYFPGSEAILRHPTVLYEAFGEGLLLFLLLHVAGRFRTSSGFVTALFLLLYAFIRYVAEWYREPDPGREFIFGVLTTGQGLSVAMAVIALLVFLFSRRRVVY